MLHAHNSKLVRDSSISVSCSSLRTVTAGRWSLLVFKSCFVEASFQLLISDWVTQVVGQPSSTVFDSLPYFDLLRGSCIFRYAWLLWSDSTLFLHEQWPADGWLSELLLWVGHSGLFSCIDGSMFCSGRCLHCDICHSRHCIWIPCCYHGCAKNMAEALPHTNQKRTYEGKIPALFPCVVETCVHI